jgi:DNA primase
VLDLVAAMERCSLRRAALLLTEWFGQAPWPAHHIGGERKIELIREKEVKPVPLRFSLRPVDTGHPYLRQRGIDADTATRFGVGYYAGPGFMHDRVVIPIHDEHGQRLAYAGRSICGGGPKYKLPAGFPKSRVLFNLHRARACDCDRVIVVEGFFDCLKVDQAGVPNVVALMGCCLSSRQEKLLVGQFRNVTLMLDADGAGQHGTRVIADRLSRQCVVQIIHLEDGQQPDQLSSAEIRRALSVVSAAPAVRS